MLIRVLSPRRQARDEVMLEQVQRCVEGKKPVFFLVPEQATAEFENALARRLGAPSQRYLEVTNFSRLRDVVLRQVGGVARRVPSEEEKNILLALTLLSLGDQASLLCRRMDPDSVAELASDLEEARLAGLDEGEMLRLAESGEVGERLAEKLRIAALVESGWNRRKAALAEVCPDPEEQLCLALDQAPFFAGAAVFVHDFRDFTAPQERILRRMLTQAEEVWVSLPCEKKENDLYEKPFRAARRLLQLARSAGVDVRDETVETKEEGGPLVFLSENVLRSGRTWQGEAKEIGAFAAADEVEEAVFVASRIRRAVVEEGCRWSEIAVLSRSGEMDRVLSQVLSEAEIPHFLEKKTPLTATMAAGLVLTAAKIALGLAFRGEEREYLQNSLLYLEDGERFLLEKYVKTWRLSPLDLLRSEPFTKNPQGYGQTNKDTLQELGRVNRAREKIIVPLQALAMALSQGTVRERVAALVAFLKAAGAEQTVRETIAAARAREDFEGTAAPVREWNSVLSRLGSLAEIAGDEDVEGRNFFFLLGLALGGDAPGEVPPAQDAVFVGTVDFARPTGLKKLFFTGMNAGVFPRGETPGHLFSETERAWIGDRGYALSHPELRRKEEAFFFSLAARLPREELVLTYRTRGDQARDKGSESIFLKRCLTLFPGLTILPAAGELESPVTARDAFRTLLGHLDEPGIEKSPWYQYFAAKEEYAPLLLTAASGMGFDSGYALHREKPYAKGDFSMSYSGIEQYNKCPFQFFANRLLKAKEDPSGDLGAAPVGTLVHEFLERFIGGLIREGADLGSVDDATLEKNARALMAELIQSWFGGEIPPSLQHQLDLVTRDAMTLLKVMQKEAQVTSFRPVLLEQRLEDLPEQYAVTLPDGRHLKLVGSIDRVDHYCAADGTDYVRVVDYKTGTHAFKLEDVASGMDLQMLLYLFALWGKPVPLPPGEIRPQPAGVLYLSGTLKEDKDIKEDDLSRIEAEDILPLQREGLFVDDKELLAAQDPEGKGRFIPLFYNRQHECKNLVTMEKMGRLKRKVEADLSRLTGRLCNGEIPAQRLKKGDKDDPCNWCAYLALCKRDPNRDKRSYLKNPTEEEIFGKEDRA